MYEYEMNECEYCGKLTKYFRENPYQAEVNQDYSEHWICDDCYYEFTQNI